MSAPSDETTDKIRPKPRPGSTLSKWIMKIIYLFFGASVLFVLVTGALIVRLKSGPLVLPGVQDTVAQLAKDALSDFDVRVGDVSLVTAEKGITMQVQLADLQIFTKTGQKIAEFPIVRAKIDPIQSLLNEIEVETIEIVGAEIRVLRDYNGKFNILPPGDDDAELVNPEVIFAAANIVAAKPPLRSLRLINMIDTKLVYVDRINSRLWQTSETSIQSTREGDVISAIADVVMTTKDRADTSVGLRFTYSLGEEAFGFGFKFDQASTVDLADQVPALDWLRSFDAAITGSLNAEVQVSGGLNTLSGVLKTEKGQLFDSPNAEPIKFSNVKTYFEYAKATDSLKFTEITAKSAVGSINGEGSISMFRNETGAVDALSGSVNLSDLQLYPEGVFSEPLAFESASVNAHMTLSPFAVTLENSTLKAGDLEITMSGSSVAGDEFWGSSYFVRFNEAKRDDVLKYWPINAKPKTRKWISENILDGVVKNGVGQLRTRNGKPSVDLKFDFEQGKARYLKTMPILQGAAGKGHLTEKMFTAKLSKGYVIASNEGLLDVASSTFTVPDLTKKPAFGEVSLRAKGSLQSALSILDEKPFEYLKKTNLEPTMATGSVVAEAQLTVPLVKGTKPTDVRFSANAEITNMSSKKLVKKHTVTADKVILVANDDKVELSGDIELDGIPTKTKWLMPIGKAYDKRSVLTSDFVLSDVNLRKIGVEFEKGTITGATSARMNVTLQPGKQPTYSISSEMVGLGVNIASLNWSKSKQSKGVLSVKGKLGDKFSIDTLSLKANALAVQGTVLLNKDNSIKQADFSKLTVGQWLDAAVTIKRSGPNKTKVIVKSGTADLRKVSFAKKSNSKGTNAGAPMDVTLDRLILTDGIILTGVRANLTNVKGLSGPYSAQINGGAKITGRVFPHKHGTAAEINSADAGRVLRSANLYKQALGGGLRLVIVPMEKEGHYQGTYKIKNTNVKEDNVLADILNAVSVVGALQQLSGDGIVFETVEGQFTLKPKGVELRQTSATGVSIGLTLGGNYNSTTKNVNFEGVITPLYAVNGTLQRVFGKVLGRQKGEGLFSFVYKVSGSSSAPKITVNPLSILAPGVVREVFRSEIPEVDATGEPKNNVPKDKPIIQEVDR